MVQRKALLLITALLSLGLWGSFYKAEAQHVAFKTNLVSWIPGSTPNLSLETAISRKWTIDLQGSANWFMYQTDASKPDYNRWSADGKKWSHWMVQPEFRYWFCDVFDQWNIGFHGFGGQMNVGGVNIPYMILQNKPNADGVYPMQGHRYEGWFAGGGVSLGYHWLISNHFSIEGSLGAGYAHIWYDRFKCVTCGEKDGSGEADYVGPTKAALSLILLF